MRSAVILAGGSSSRLGDEKALLLFGGRPLICWTAELLCSVADEIVVVARDEAHACHLEKATEDWLSDRIALTWDSVPGFGPVAGLDAGLRKARGQFAFATGCDLPFLNAGVVDRLFELVCRKDCRGEGYEAAVPVQPNGLFEPLHSVYHREKMGESCRLAVENGERRIYAPLQQLHFNCVPMELLRPTDPDLLSFFNLNTREDLERARSLWPKRQAKYRLRHSALESDRRYRPSL